MIQVLVCNTTARSFSTNQWIRSLTRTRSYRLNHPSCTNHRSTSSSATRDTRLAGRRRFYKHVGITAVRSPPWYPLLQQQQQQSPFKDSSLQFSEVQVPGGAGVDGSNSAAGISLEKPTVESMQEMLIPSQILSSSASIAGRTAQELSISWYGITLDQRLIRTPLGTPFCLPSLPLALAVASEWSNQQKYLQPSLMPLMTLCCTALDQMTIPSVRKDVVTKLLAYLKNDTSCYWADPTEDRVLYKKQEKAWSGLHEWASTGKNGLRAYMSGTKQNGNPLFIAKAIGSGEGLIMSRSKNHGNRNSGLPHSDLVLELAEAFLWSLDAWRLTSMQAITMEAKSFLVGMAAVVGGSPHLAQEKDVKSNKGNDQIKRSTQKSTVPFVDNTSKLITAARVEEEFQIENWGLVEGGHDYDRLNCSIQMHSAIILASCVEAETSKRY